MRSQTLIPLSQFIDWLGIEPYNAAGVDYDNSNASPGTVPTRKNRDACECVLEYPWNSSPQTWSRQDLIEMLQLAEDTFIRYARFHPASYFIEYEEQKYKPNLRLKNNILSLPSFVPFYGCCEPIYFGTADITFIENVSLLRSPDDIEVLPNFTATVTVPENTLSENIRVYFPAYTPEGYNDHEFEIRPLTITVSGTTATIVGPAYLFVDPDLAMNSKECLKNNLDSYVESIDVYITSINNCNSGSFIYNSPDCGASDCENLEQTFCATRKVVGNCSYGVPRPVDDNCENAYLKGGIHSIKYHYLTGKSVKAGGLVDRKIANTVFKLAIGLSVCIKEYCKCAVCLQDKIQYYRSVPKEVTARDAPPAGSDNDYQYTLLITKEIMNSLGGSAPPNYGVLQALREIHLMRCNNVEGSILS